MAQVLDRTECARPLAGSPMDHQGTIEIKKNLMCSNFLVEYLNGIVLPKPLYLGLRLSIQLLE